jgi:SMC interacting uncharacterized protein involved in chromosome segregation
MNLSKLEERIQELKTLINETMEYLDELHTELDEAEKQFNYYQKNNAH